MNILKESCNEWCCEHTNAWLLLFHRHSFCLFALGDMKRSSVDLNIT